MQTHHEGYVYRINSYARYLLMTHSNEEIKEAIEARRKQNGDAEGKDLRDVCVRLYKKKQLTGRLS